MAYNGRNFLERVIEIQNITREHTERGCTQKWVYQHIIHPRFKISIDTYYKYLSRNAKRELRTLKEINHS